MTCDYDIFHYTIHNPYLTTCPLYGRKSKSKIITLCLLFGCLYFIPSITIQNPSFYFIPKFCSYLDKTLTHQCLRLLHSWDRYVGLPPFRSLLYVSGTRLVGPLEFIWFLRPHDTELDSLVPALTSSLSVLPSIFIQI